MRILFIPRSEDEELYKKGEHTFTCENCKAVVAFVKSDVQDLDHEINFPNVTCPECKYVCTLNSELDVYI